MNVLVVSPHPDDETLGAGGSILRYKEEGNKVYWLNITNMKKEYGYEEEQIKEKLVQIKQVQKDYNIDGFYDLKLQPAGIDKYSKSEIIGKVSEVINKVKPDIIILPYSEDVHSDHQLIFDLVYSCTKIFRYPFISKILCMEILSETEFACSDNGFSPNYFINIEQYLGKKIEIMKTYKNEIGEHPFPRSEESIKALAILRGASSGVKYAEAFKLIKAIE